MMMLVFYISLSLFSISILVFKFVLESFCVAYCIFCAIEVFSFWIYLSFTCYLVILSYFPVKYEPSNLKI